MAGNKWARRICLRHSAGRCHEALSWVFIPNLSAPKGWTVTVPRVDEEVQVGTRKVGLGGAEFVDGRMEGEAHLFLKEFRYEWQIPVWIFEIDDCVVEKRIIMSYGHNTAYAKYKLLSGRPIQLCFRPYVTFRMHDDLLRYPSE